MLPDGRVGDVRVVRSLDQTYGLDDEAVKAAKQWRFTPGTKDGTPVPVLVTTRDDVHAQVAVSPRRTADERIDRPSRRLGAVWFDLAPST